MCKAPFGLKDLLRAREARRGKHGGRDAVLRGPPGMQALAHRAKHLPQASGLGPGDSKSPCHASFIKAEEMPGGGGGTECAGRPSDVKAPIVVLRKDGACGSAGDLEAKDGSMEECRPRS